MRIFKNLNKNIMIRPFLVLVIDIFVIRICLEFRYSNFGFPLEFRYSNFGFPRHPQIDETYESI